MRNQQLKHHIKLMPKPAKYTLLKSKKSHRNCQDYVLKWQILTAAYKVSSKPQKNSAQIQNDLGTNFITFNTLWLRFNARQHLASIE